MEGCSVSVHHRDDKHAWLSLKQRSFSFSALELVAKIVGLAPTLGRWTQSAFFITRIWPTTERMIGGGEEEGLYFQRSDNKCAYCELIKASVEPVAVIQRNRVISCCSTHQSASVEQRQK